MLALLEYFWDWGGAPSPSPSPSPSPAPTPAPDTAGARGRQKRKYIQAPNDFWEVRERYIRRFVEKARKTIFNEVPLLPVEEETARQDEPDVMSQPSETLLLRQAFDVAARRAQNAQTISELRTISDRLRSLALDISKIEQQNYDRAIALLLLDVF